MRRFAASLLLLLGAGTAAADPADCELKQVAVLETTESADGAILVPVGIDDRPARLELDTGAFWSVLRPELAEGIGWHHSDVGLAGAGGEILDRVATVPRFTLGGLALARVDFILGPEGMFAAEPAVGGLLAANLLKAFDLEIDPAAHRVRLFSQDHCKGAVIHWPHGDLIVAPLTIARDGQITIPVTLDGVSLHAQIDTGAASSVLHLDVAARKFDLDPSALGTAATGAVATADGQLLPRWEHRFRSLAIEGAAFNAPVLAIAPNRMKHLDESGVSGEKPADLELGMRQLRLLHLYIAYGEKMLYATTVKGDAAADAAAKP